MGLSTSAPPYFDQSDAEAFLSKPILLSLCDDANNGVVDPVKFNKLGNLACSKVDAVLARVYSGTLPITTQPTPQLVVECALLWLRALLFESHREFVREYGSGPRDEANARCEDLAIAKALILDWAGTGPPANVGAVVVSSGPRLITDNADGSSNSGDF